MDSNKTLNCNGTYSTSTIDVSWSQPVLTSNTGNSELQVSSTTLAGSSEEPWTLFDDDVNSGYYWQGKNGTYPATIYITTAKSIKISSIRFMNGASYYPRSGYIARNGSSIKSWSSSAGNKEDWSVTVDSTDYSTSHSIVIQSSTSSTYGPRLKKIYITATYGQTSYTYYWDKTVS